MIVPGEIAAAHRRADRAGSRLRRAEHERREPRVHERADAHQARLDRHVQRRADEAIVADVRRGVANGDRGDGRGRSVERRDSFFAPYTGDSIQIVRSTAFAAKVVGCSDWLIRL